MEALAAYWVVFVLGLCLWFFFIEFRSRRRPKREVLPREVEKEI